MTKIGDRWREAPSFAARLRTLQPLTPDVATKPAAVGPLTLAPSALVYAVGPILVLIVSSWLFSTYGQTAPHYMLETHPDGRLESAGRLRAIAMWLVLAIVGVGCLGLWAKELMRFDRRSARMLAGAWIITAATLTLSVSSGNFQGRAERVLGEHTICNMLQPPPKTKAVFRDQQGQLEAYRRCTSEDPYFARLAELNSRQLALLLLFLPAMLFGAVSCAAGPPDRRDEQVLRLKTFTYLSAALVAAGLLFLSALLHWPAGALSEGSARIYNAHVSSYLLYWAVTYSAMIAAYYIPLSAKLSGGLVGPAAAAGDLHPLDALKTIATIFAPVITALLGDIVHF
ncbi:MAG: hypothetical protein JO013_12325 [Alphaproteobacteria bacterium]|nr:hypothetical protein [Alphaproteobacteria bacterium]